MGIQLLMSAVVITITRGYHVRLNLKIKLMCPSSLGRGLCKDYLRGLPLS
jgi:hypothetical protein